MPPLPAWFDGGHAVEKFFSERVFVFTTPRRLQPVRGNRQPGFACYLQQPGDSAFRPGGVVLLDVHRGRIASIDSSSIRPCAAVSACSTSFAEGLARSPASHR